MEVLQQMENPVFLHGEHDVMLVDGTSGVAKQAKTRQTPSKTGNKQQVCNILHGTGNCPDRNKNV
jgi:hypothetical protein